MGARQQRREQRGRKSRVPLRAVHSNAHVDSGAHLALRCTVAKLREGLQAQYEAANKGVEELKATAKPRLKLLKAASAPAGGAGGKDEV